MQGQSPQLLQRLISEAGLAAPDGRSLHQYRPSPEQFAELECVLCSRLAPGDGRVPMGAAFVFWAAEHVRARFPGGQLTWAFIFGGLALPEDRGLGIELVRSGLPWWGRRVRISEAGHRMFLYTLMAEGGLPEALLAQAGHYRRVVLGLLADIEAEGGAQTAPFADRIAARWIAALPQTFQSGDFARLMAEFALALAGLRAMLPEDLPAQAAERWLDANRPGWKAELPLRLSPEILERLIRPALHSERGGHSQTGGPLATRELHHGETGGWNWFVRVANDGFLPDVLLPGASDLRLRLLPMGAAAEHAATLVYSATPDQGGWQIRRFGRLGATLIPLPTDIPLVLGAYADGRPKGEVVIAPDLPSPADAPSFWRAADPSEGQAARRLVPQPGSGRARAPLLWLLTSETAEPQAAEGLSLAGPESVPGGRLWRVAGRGTLTIGTRHVFRIQTEAETEQPEARLVPVGEVLPGWRMERDKGLVYRGLPKLFGETGAAGLKPLPERLLRPVRVSGRMLGDQILEWVEQNEVRAQVRFVCLPPTVRISVAEEAAGRVRLVVAGLPNDTRLVLRAGGVEARSNVASDAAQIVLAVGGAPPGLLTLRLSDPGTGAALALVAPWPARAGLILGPNGARLERDEPLSVDGLRGWHALVPEGDPGDLELHLVGHSKVAFPVAGEVPLYPYVPLIRAMLAQGGPDAQVNLRLIVRGGLGRRLEIRRYHEQAIVEGDRLRTGIPRDTKPPPETALSMQLDRRPLTLHAVDLTAAAKSIVIEDTPERNLRTLLGPVGGPWLIQSRLSGRVQRAVAWGPSPIPPSTRAERTAAYAGEWQRLLDAPANTAWERLWSLIANLSQAGDAGVADQVQALAKVPAAAVALVMRVPQAALADALALDMAAPLFWPALPSAAFVLAIRAEVRRSEVRFSALFEPEEAAEEVRNHLASRTAAILLLRPELAGHFAAALVEAGLTQLAASLSGHASLPRFLFADPGKELRELAQIAARRFDRLPSGVGRIAPLNRPDGLAFNHYAQPVIDAPLVAAELATEWRPAASVEELLDLINLRLVDPGYFDAAMPAAIAFVCKEPNR